MDKINDDHFSQERDRIRLIHLFWKGMTKRAYMNPVRVFVIKFSSEVKDKKLYIV